MGSIYIYLTFRSIGRSTTLNIPVYEYVISFQLLVSSFFWNCSMIFSAQIFHFLRRLLCCLVGTSRVRDGKDGLMKTVTVPSLPSVPTLWLPVVQQCWAMPFTSAYKWAPCWGFSLKLSIHLSIGMSARNLPMPGLCPRAPGIPTYEWSY